MRSKKPLIGIAVSQAAGSDLKRWPSRYPFDWLNKAYHLAIEKSGGVPVGIFNTDDSSIASEYLNRLDGLLFTGGADIDPLYFGQELHPATKKAVSMRDHFELMLLQEALEIKLPIFCICRGHQMLNIALKGTLYQDLSLYPTSTLVHADPEQTGKVDHDVAISEGSLFLEIVGQNIINCNSSHHQAIDKLGKGLRVVAKASDGIIEAIELEDHPILISVQWHPERIYDRPHSKRLIDAFVEKVRNGT